MAASVMQKSASYNPPSDTIAKKSSNNPKNGNKKRTNSKPEDELPSQQTMMKSASYSEDMVRHKTNKKGKKAVFSASNNRDLHSKNVKKSRPRTRKRGQTNKFMSSVNVGQTVKLSQHRVGFIRYKGKVKFAIGVWYGLEIYDSFIKTRHNGTVYGKRYFNCPRNKGLFVKRDVIMSIIKPQHIKKELQEHEQKQIKRKKLEKEKEAAAARKVAIDTRKGMGLTHTNNQNSMLALYQKQVYGNNKLILKITNENKQDDIERQVHKDFARFRKLSFRASHNPEIFSIMMDNEREENDNKDEEDEQGGLTPNELLPQGVDIDAEAWDSFKERPIIEVLDEDDNGDDDMCHVRLFHPLNTYFLQYEHVFNKGILIKEMHHHSKQGRALILECGVQGNDRWYIMNVNEENIKKYSKTAVDEILDRLLPDIGYDIVLKRE
eukprot:37655_1